MSTKTAFDTYISYQFVRGLATDWIDTPAYKLGIIDKTGKLLKSSSKFTTTAEKEAFTFKTRLIFNLKRLLEKIPGGKSKIARYGTALALLKEHKAYVEEILIESEAPVNVTAGIAILDKPLKKKKKKKKKDIKMISRSEQDKIEKTDELELTSIEQHILSVDEGKIIKRVIRKGKRVKKVVCTGPNQKVVGGRCVTKTAKDKLRLKKASKKRVRSMKGKSQAGKIRRMLKSRKKRA